MRWVGVIPVALIAGLAWGDDLRVLVHETPETVQLHIVPSEAVEPGSIEVRLVGRKIAVLARSAETGRTIRAQAVHVEAPVVEEDARADYEPDGSLTVTLHKRSPPAT